MLSVIVLTHNDEEVILKCLKSLSDQDWEVIVVDSFSSDKTPSIVRKEKIPFFQNQFEDFSSQRNFALTLVKGDWILYLDSDEVATREFKNEINNLVHSYKMGDPVAYYVKRNNYFLNQEWGYIDRMQRLFRKEFLTGWQGKLHETASVRGDTGVIESPIIHNTHRNLEQMLSKTNEWSDYEAELRIKAHHPLMTPLRFVRVFITGFLKSYIKENGYKNGTRGVIESMFQGFSLFITYAKLFELQQKN